MCWLENLNTCFKIQALAKPGQEEKALLVQTVLRARLDLLTQPSMADQG